MFSSFYNAVSLHTLFAQDPSNKHSQQECEYDTLTPLTFVSSETTPVTSVTLQASIVPSPNPKMAKGLNDYNIVTQIRLRFPSLPIILPFGRFSLVWSIVLCLILTYTVIETPYTVVFVGSQSLYNYTYIISLFIDALLLVDIVINFRTAYIDRYDHLRIIHNPILIAKHYLSTWFIVDFIAAFPFSLISLLFYRNFVKYLLLFRMLRLIKLVRIMKILRMFKFFQQHTLKYETRSTLKMFRIFTFMLLTAHYCACLWYFVGFYSYNNGMNSWIDTMIEDESVPLNNIPNFRLYSYSIYWSITTLFTTGYGDIAAHNCYEQWTAICCILIGSMFFAYFIGTLSSLMTEDRVHHHHHQKIEESLLFCSHYNLPKELTQAIVTHVGYYQKYNFTFSQYEIMDALPNYLQKSVQIHLAKHVLRGLDIFQSLSPCILGKIALRLKSKSINTAQLLFKAGDIGKELYIQRTGKSKLYYGGLTAYARSLKRGDVCGENVIMNRTRLHSVRCETWSEFYVLDIRDIINILKNNLEPIEAQKEWEKIKQTVRQTMDTVAPRHIKHFMRTKTNAVPKSDDSTTTEEFSVEESESSEHEQKTTLSFRSLQQLFNTQAEKSVLRNKNVLKNFSKQKSDLLIELPGGFEEDMCYDCKLHPINDGSEDSEESGGFGERFGLYKIRKHKKKAPDLSTNIPKNITIFDDILGPLTAMDITANNSYDDDNNIT